MPKRRAISISKEALDEILAIPTAPAGDHLTDEEFAAYVTNRTADIDVHKIDAHLASCVECCRELELLLEVAESCPQSEVTRRVESAFAQAAALQPSADEANAIERSQRWLTSPPSPVEVARYLAGQSPDADAMRAYFSRPGIGRNLLSSLYVSAIRELLNVADAAREYREEMRASLAGLARDFSDSILDATATRSLGSGAASGEITTPAVLAMASRTAAAAFYYTEGPAGKPLSAVTADRFATAEIALNTASTVWIRVVSEVEYSGRHVLVELLCEQIPPIHATIQLTESEGTDEARGEAVVAVDNAERLLRNCTVLIAWLPY